MKLISKIIVLFGLLCSISQLSWSRERELRDELAFLTDKQNKGRAFGSPELQSVSFYLYRQFKAAGLRTTVQSFAAGGKVGHNIIGVTPGWFKEYIVVGAYYDGVGEINGEVYPSADANASGVAVMLSLALSLPKHADGAVGVIFLAMDGHSASMSGAKSFVEQYKFIYNIKLMVNLDTMGSSLEPVNPRFPDYIIALGASSYRFALDNANRQTRLDINYDYYGSSNFTNLFYRNISDQKWFLQAGIPAVMFTSGITKHTNKSTDTMDNLDLPMLTKRLLLIETWLQHQL